MDGGHVDVLSYLTSKNLAPRSASRDEVSLPCIFHGEDPGTKRGRLYINVSSDPQTAGLYMCHVCGEKGNLVTLMRHFGDEPQRDDEDDNRYNRQQILRIASAYYHSRLEPEHIKWLREQRGLSAQTIQKHELGWADGGLYKHLRDQGFELKDMMSTGLIAVQKSDSIQSDGTLVLDAGAARPYDFLRECITIPYHVAGNTVQIRGRSLRDSGPKYLTPPRQEARLFNTDAVWNNETVVVTEGEFDCYSGDTEVLTPEGWVALAEYAGQDVVQWETDGSLSVVAPSAFVSKHADETLRLFTEQRGGIDLLVTPSHRMVSTKADGTGLKVHSANDRPSAAYHVPRVGFLDGPGIELSDDEICLLLAIQADASIDVRKLDGAQYVRFGLTKDRKKIRLRQALDNLGIEYSDELIESNPGVSSICFRVPNYIKAFKLLPQEWLSVASVAQRKFIMSELPLWDGNSVKGRGQWEFSSSIPHNAEWVQTLAHTMGMVATTHRRSNSHGEWRKVSILWNKKSTSWQSIRREDCGPGMVYCLSVPSTFLLVRRHEHIAISGNCMVAEQLGYPAVGCAGAKTWQDSWDSYFDGMRRVYIVFDNDAPGQLGADAIKDRLGRKSRSVLMPFDDVPPGENDISRYFGLEGHGADEFEQLLRKADKAGTILITVDEAYEEWLSLQGVQGLQYGFEEFDAYMKPGHLASQVWIVLAKTNVGKTLFLLNAFQAIRMAPEQQDKKILFVSLEQTRGDWFERARRIWNFWNLECPPLDVNHAALDFWRDNLLITDVNRMGVGELIAAIDDFTDEMGQPPDLVAIDYLGYWARSFKGLSKYEQVSEAIMSLKEVAKERRVPVLAPHQVGRSQDFGKEVDVDSGRDSGAIEETADAVFQLWNPDNQPGKEVVDRTGRIRLKIGKTRAGSKGRVADFQFGYLSLAMAELSNSARARLLSDEIDYDNRDDMSHIVDKWEAAIFRHKSGRRTGDITNLLLEERGRLNT